MKKVLFVISTLNTGGAQRAFSNIIMALPKEYEVDILLNDSENIVYPYRGKIVDLGLKPEKNKKKISYQMKVFAKRYVYLRKLKKQENYIACISALESANFVNVLTGNKYCKCILSVRNYLEKSVENPYISNIIMWVIKTFYNRADKIVAVSNGIRKNLIDSYKIKEEKICTIYNGYDVEKIIENSRLSIDKNLNLDMSGRIIVASGRLTKQKGFVYLINCFMKVSKVYSDVKLIILGEGELRGELEGYIKSYGLEKKVLLPGFVENPFSIISKSDIFILSSLYEGYPNVLAEAIICGVPCISTDCRTGPREILADGEKRKVTEKFELAEYGILCSDFLESEIYAEKTITEALVELLGNQELYTHYKRQCEKKKKELEMKKIIRQWINEINSN